MYRVAICDDEPDILQWLEETLNNEYGTRLSISTYKSAAAFLEEMNACDNSKTDIILMDIKLQDANGIEVLKSLQEKCKAKIIFITGYLDYAQDIFKVNPSYLLKKPLEVSALFEAMNKVMKIIEEEDRESYTVLFQGNVTRVKLQDILYFESEKRKIILHSRQGTIETYKKLNEVERELEKTFLRCHQSFLVNMNEIERFGSNVIEMYGGKKVPISRAKFKDARDKFLRYIGEII